MKPSKFLDKIVDLTDKALYKKGIGDDYTIYWDVEEGHPIMKILHPNGSTKSYDLEEARIKQNESDLSVKDVFKSDIKDKVFGDIFPEQDQTITQQEGSQRKMGDLSLDEFLDLFHEILPDDIAVGFCELDEDNGQSLTKHRAMYIKKNDTDVNFYNVHNLYCHYKYDEPNLPLDNFCEQIANNDEILDNYLITSSFMDQLKQCIKPVIADKTHNFDSMHDHPESQFDYLTDTHLFLGNDFNINYISEFQGPHSTLYRMYINNDILESLLPEISNIRRFAFQNYEETSFPTINHITDNPVDMYIARYETPIHSLKNINASNIILDYCTFDSIKEKIGEDFYIIPSSIYEYTIIPAKDDIDEDRLKQIITETNNGDMYYEHILSFDLYYYDYANDSINNLGSYEMDEPDYDDPW